MKIGPCDFPEPVLTALRDRRLLVFAGAGVSRGAPANLPDFAELATRIAAGTGEALSSMEREDAFLGKLKDRGVDVHSRAVQALSGDGVAPTALHRDLLRFYPGVEQVRIVTTNYDRLFEQAAPLVFAGTMPECFRAPALPLGHRFTGIVHVHGEISHPSEMVLTDADFGRGYLVEGWARRFLVDLFRHFTVLFVGYSHNDLIVSYLARALPESKAGQRFALTGASDDSRRWRVLGIEPIGYPQSNDSDFSALYEAVRCLADTASRSVLDWRREVSALAEKLPPLSDEDVGIIDYALQEPSTTRFFVETARLPEWLEWLDQRAYLAALFQEGRPLIERHATLARWIAKHFAARYPDHVFLLIAQHKMRLHPDSWFELGREIALGAGDPLPPATLSRWISVLLRTAPEKVDTDVLRWLGRRCIREEAVVELLMIFGRMAESSLSLQPGFSWPAAADPGAGQRVDADSEFLADHDAINELWQKGVSPNLALLAEPLLRLLVGRLEDRHALLRVWRSPSSDLDWTSLRRSAIEPYEHDDRYPEAIDVVIDAARDCLQWLAANRAVVAAGWCDQLIRSEAPLLRRLAVHALPARSDLSADEKVRWLLTTIGLHQPDAYVESLRATRLIYPAGGNNQRAALIAAVLAYQSPDEEDPNNERRTAHEIFDWLRALCSADSACVLARQALDDLLARWPDLRERAQDDLARWTGSVVAGSRSPWSVDELLSRSAADWLPELLGFDATDIMGPDRYGLARAIREVVTRQVEWGMGLAEALADTGEWNTDLWSALLQAWGETNLKEIEFRNVLSVLGRAELYREHAREVADALHGLVRNDGKPYALNLLSRANEIAFALWPHLDSEEVIDNDSGWLQSAINRPAGILALFWIGSLVLWRKHQERKPTSLNEEYLRVLSPIVDDPTLSGLLARSVLASQLALFMTADEAWTRERLLPLFSSPDRGDFQAAWDGFLTWGRLSPAVAEALADAFSGGFQRIQCDLPRQRFRFVEYYTAMVVVFVEDPRSEWIPRLFQQGSTELRRAFASQVGRHLHDFDANQQREAWQRWLKQYWEDRLQGVPAVLERLEIEQMLEWLPHLSAVFEEAVGLAIRMRRLPLRHCSSVHDLQKSQLPTTYPEAVARLLIYLGQCESPGYIWHQGRELVDRLVLAGLPANVQQDLRKLLARLGLG